MNSVPFHVPWLSTDADGILVRVCSCWVFSDMLGDDPVIAAAVTMPFNEQRIPDAVCHLLGPDDPWRTRPALKALETSLACGSDEREIPRRRSSAGPCRRSSHLCVGGRDCAGGRGLMTGADVDTGALLLRETTRPVVREDATSSSGSPPLPPGGMGGACERLPPPILGTFLAGRSVVPSHGRSDHTVVLLFVSIHCLCPLSCLSTGRLHCRVSIR